MDTLDKFLVKEFLTYFFFSWLGLALLAIGVDFFSNFWKLHFHESTSAVTQGVSALRLLVYYAYKMPAALQQFLPVATLLGVLLLFSTLSRQNEILALYSSGIGPWRPLSTLFAVLSVMSAVSFMLLDRLVPTCEKQQILMRLGKVESDNDSMLFGDAGLWYRSGKLVYSVHRFFPRENLLDSVVLYEVGDDFRLKGISYARVAQFTSHGWELRQGATVRFPQNHPFPTWAPFGKQNVVLPEKPGDFKAMRFDHALLQLRELRQTIRRDDRIGVDTTDERIQYHERLALVFTPFVFLLLAASFALRPIQTQTIAKNVGLCVLIVFVYLLSSKTLLSVGKGGHLSPFFAGWIPNFGFTLMGIGLLFRNS